MCSVKHFSSAECRLIPCLNRFISEDNPELCILVLSAMRCLLYNNQKVCLLLLFFWMSSCWLTGSSFTCPLSLFIFSFAYFSISFFTPLPPPPPPPSPPPPPLNRPKSPSKLKAFFSLPWISWTVCRVNSSHQNRSSPLCASCWTRCASDLRLHITFHAFSVRNKSIAK